MANALYDKARESFLGQDPALDWDTDTIKVFLLDAAEYTPDLANHQYLSDVPVAARKGNAGGNTRADAPTLNGKTVTAGVADANDCTITAVPAGNALEYILIFKDDGVADASSPLIALVDTATGLPVTPNGGDITIQWDNGANKIFKL